VGERDDAYHRGDPTVLPDIQLRAVDRRVVDCCEAGLAEARAVSYVEQPHPVRGRLHLSTSDDRWLDVVPELDEVRGALGDVKTGVVAADYGYRT
jgi:hypothetical protein